MSINRLTLRLATDLSGLAQGLQGQADMNAIDQLAADVARL